MAVHVEWDTRRAALGHKFRASLALSVLARNDGLAALKFAPVHAFGGADGFIPADGRGTALRED